MQPILEPVFFWLQEEGWAHQC